MSIQAHSAVRRAVVGLRGLGFLIHARSPGTYAVCWCRGACLASEDFRVPLGELRLAGPSLGQSLECALGRNCTIELLGVQLAAGDGLVVRDRCAADGVVGGLRAASDGLQRYLFPAVVARAGIYEACWGRPPSGMRVLVGYIRLRGPYEVDASCVYEVPCRVHVAGVGLVAGDALRVASACATSSVVARGTLSADGEAELNWSEEAPGKFALCWCPQASPCATASEFFRVGQVRVECGPGTYEVRRRASAVERGLGFSWPVSALRKAESRAIEVTGRLADHSRRSWSSSTT